MTATLKFNLSKEDDKIDYLRCVKADEMAFALFDFSAKAKKEIKWEIDTKENIDPLDVVELCFTKFYEILELHNINLDELIQ